MPSEFSASPTSPIARRAPCRRCELPASACLCRWTQSIDNAVDLLLLQHPQEQHQAKGSARLLRLSIAHCRLWVGEQFEASALLAALTAGGRRALLLYPPTPGQTSPVFDASADDARPLRLVVIDATWRKSRKMLLLNPALQALPRLAVRQPPPSRYAAHRKAERAEQRSTLEAAVLALQSLEANPERYEPLLQAFSGWLDERQDRVPAAASVRLA
ncbi:DTW domain-containing protein [Paucibacter sp. DJ1R-11]|uniref:tRNA-uridine aminocarboxypropyltransferase n=1 Tax=Paucibacter sp. DJ1R-11 TaxID=2893556 RepID=UPI0021E3EDAF|nr:tRNA-uridine aminocarboxypropyltransferase [Paucibacter sp. DJ1R-11]MCV2362410.1 DTW domain-containing protein [Paucibacter sp. DJ1R-11]